MHILGVVVHLSLEGKRRGSFVTLVVPLVLLVLFDCLGDPQGLIFGAGAGPRRGL